MTGMERTRARILLDPSSSLKRIAWAYGCSPRGSDGERQLEDLLRRKVALEQENPK